MNVQNLSLPRGDHRIYDLEVEDENGNPVSLAGSTLWFTVKQRESQSDAESEFQLTSANPAQINPYSPAEGKAYIYVENLHTQDLDVIPYVYDVQLKTAAGKPYTVVKGNFTIVGDVTRAV